MKTVLITGGARRLGRALVEHFAQQGWQVLFTCQWSFEEGTALAESLGAHVHCLRTAVSSQRSASMIAGWAQGYTAELDLLICNASTFMKTSVESVTPDEFGDLLESNLLGPFFLIQQCLSLLRAAQGSVVNIADAQATGGVAEFAPYVATKAGLISITKTLAIELAPQVRINAVLPGTLPWPENPSIYSHAAKEKTLAEIPMATAGSWHAVVQAVSYLDAAKYVTGICMPVDGGRSARF
ncbi:SDR family oxidoreductase [Noviherbaspirillum pedocola]|uniref:SDR family oxidoreductase n=1 Tax=Noviherbaspirillum pedocola TaxID=2801341 RepID=A0A934SZJ3_9BURK|nr:SDR family oxidoreductase [Noviherbaspirillum pedocola]MBK4735887.1 SDR family oxidoreductase [Noviherbaspirillum pedocola]